MPALWHLAHTRAAIVRHSPPWLRVARLRLPTVKGTNTMKRLRRSSVGAHTPEVGTTLLTGWATRRTAADLLMGAAIKSPILTLAGLLAALGAAHPTAAVRATLLTGWAAGAVTTDLLVGAAVKSPTPATGLLATLGAADAAA